MRDANFIPRPTSGGPQIDRLSDYDFHLPEELIAQTPLTDRSASRLLHLDRRTGSFEHLQFVDVVDLLRPDDLLILNDTRVSALRLEGRRPTGGQVEALLLSGGPYEYEALVRPGKRLKPGAKISFGPLTAEIVEDLSDGMKLIRFEPMDRLSECLRELGQTPLPPYIHAALADSERYQTVYGVNPGSAAAPTAGLHFTQDILARITDKGVKLGWVTLHVGLDTFRPVQVENLEEHHMHGETCSIPPETANLVDQCRGRVIAVGTTAVRTLETFGGSAPDGVEPTENRAHEADANFGLQTASGKLPTPREYSRTVASGEKLSRLFIRPGYRFKVVDGMFTNFHLPRTTMMMMISALAGREQVLAAYEAAVHEKYRFLSFGDSMLII